jgi:membrane-associated phospholipid phosphatase
MQRCAPPVPRAAAPACRRRRRAPACAVRSAAPQAPPKPAVAAASRRGAAAALSTAAPPVAAPLPLRTRDAAAAATAAAAVFALLTADVASGAHLVGALDLSTHAFVTAHSTPEARALVQKVLSNVTVGTGMAVCGCACGGTQAREMCVYAEPFCARCRAAGARMLFSGRAADARTAAAFLGVYLGAFGSLVPIKDEGLLVRAHSSAALSFAPSAHAKMNKQPPLTTYSRAPPPSQGALKEAVHRARPSELASSFAFPSGHTSLAAFLWCAALLSLLPRAAPRAFAAAGLRPAAPALAAAGAAATAACRVAADVHWVSDTAAGGALGTALALVVVALTQACDEAAGDAGAAADDVAR